MLLSIIVKNNELFCTSNCKNNHSQSLNLILLLKCEEFR